MKYLLASLTLLAASSGIAHAADSYLPAPQDEYQACREMVVASARIGKYDALHHEDHYQALDEYVKDSVRQWGYGDKTVLMNVEDTILSSYNSFNTLPPDSITGENVIYDSLMNSCRTGAGQSIVNYDQMHNSPIGY
ncbi:hypothetical protein LMG33818_000060 [Halomonadaceae bacterium LMG 33818]|uniref:hypothetical protein n=1 Tax=Cernens ardua TaxID=3402176 RepID=UPI003EDC6654